LFKFIDKVPEQASLYRRKLDMHYYETFKFPELKSQAMLEKFNLPSR
jgi:hypothetical protein